MKNTIYNSLILGALLISTQSKAQHILEALEGEIPFTPSEKCLERIYDKYYGDGDHNFIYCAVAGPNGKKWLNLNLGAEYAKEGSPHFNPEAVIEDVNDWRAFGSMYQYGRDSDGHEQVSYKQKNNYWYIERINGYGNTSEGNKYQIGRPRSTSSTIGWRENYENDPCPNNYRMITISDIMLLLSGKTNIVAQNYSTANIISSPNYNIRLMFSPVAYSETNVSEFRTQTPISASFSSGNATSAIWLAYDKTLPISVWRKYDTNSVWLNDHSFLNYINPYGVDVLAIPPDENDFQAIDIGLKTIPWNAYDDYDAEINFLAVNISEYDSAPVRCVEK